jgi:hypothetical protein
MATKDCFKNDDRVNTKMQNKLDKEFEEKPMTVSIRNSTYAKQVCSYHHPILNAPCNLLHQKLGRIMPDYLFENPRRPMQVCPPIADADILRTSIIYLSFIVINRYQYKLTDIVFKNHYIIMESEKKKRMSPELLEKFALAGIKANEKRKSLSELKKKEKDIKNDEIN